MPRALVLPFVLAVATCQAQVSWNITFDPGADRTLDSLSGCWQVGHPDKPGFAGAFSVPNALVTDTVQPYPVGGLSHAAFSVPVNFFGEEVALGFMQRFDADAGEALGWIEWYDTLVTHSWVRADPGQVWYAGFVDWSGAGTDTDSALVFSGTDSNWVGTVITWRCFGVGQEPRQRASLPDSMRFRFVFQALANTHARAGWMIDDLVLINAGCLGGLAEDDLAGLAVFPNPASTELVLEGAAGAPLQLELYGADGALVRRERMAGVRHVLGLQGVADGPYLLRVISGAAQLVRRVVVQR